MIFAIIAAEAIYQGLHGMNDKAIVEVSKWKEAEEIAVEMSLNVMDSQNNLKQKLRKRLNLMILLIGQRKEQKI